MKIKIEMENMEWIEIRNILRTYATTHILDKFENQIDNFFSKKYEDEKKMNDFLNEIASNED